VVLHVFVDSSQNSFAAHFSPVTPPHKHAAPVVFLPVPAQSSARSHLTVDAIEMSHQFAPSQRTTASPLSHWHVAAFSSLPAVFSQSSTGSGAAVVVQRESCV
jgi:hypothetical protein